MNMLKFGSGIAAGIVIGSLVGMTVKRPKQVGNMKRNVSRTFHSIGNMIDSYK